MEHILEVSHLAKNYGEVQAVKDINFYVERGTLFAFLGPNGAGKSTSINTICTFLKPSAGKVMVNGYELGKEDNEIRKSIGVVFQEGVLDQNLTIEENLRIRGSFYHFSKEELEKAIQRVVEITELTGFLHRPYGKLSGGQKRRADIARALLHAPKILFLDEPTTGLDPQTRKNVWKTIRRLQKEEKMTVFLTTHYMEEADQADYCMIVDGGQVVAKGTPFELKEKYAPNRLVLKGKDEKELKKILDENNISYQTRADVVNVHIPNTIDALDILNRIKAKLEGFTVTEGSMDDVFLEITGREIRQ